MTESGTLPDACIQAMIRGVAWVVKQALFGLAVEKEPKPKMPGCPGYIDPGDENKIR